MYCTAPLNELAAHVTNNTQHYRANMEFYRAGGPLFVNIPDNGDHTDRLIEHGLMHDLARDLGAALFVGDHRYGGRNVPTP